jgi:hypothetical protein
MERKNKATAIITARLVAAVYDRRCPTPECFRRPYQWVDAATCLASLG